MTDNNYVQFFSQPDPERTDITAIHLYEDGNSGRAAVYANGKAWMTGERSEVAMLALTFIGVEVKKISADDLWIDANTSNYVVPEDERALTFDGRTELQRLRRIAALRRELAALEAEQHEIMLKNPTLPYVIGDQGPITYTTS